MLINFDFSVKQFASVYLSSRFPGFIEMIFIVHRALVMQHLLTMETNTKDFLSCPPIFYVYS